MDNNELNKAVKNHPDVIHLSKVFKMECIIIAIVFVIGIVLLPPVSFLAAVCFMVVLIIFLVGGAIAKNKVRKNILEKGIDVAYAESYISRRIKVAQRQSGAQLDQPSQKNKNVKGQQVQEILDNPVVEVAASYALGRTAQNTNERAANKVINRLEKNRKTTSELLKEKDWVCGHRIPFDRNICYTCAHWNGERKVERNNILVPQNVSSAKCSKKIRTIYVVESNCRSWEPLK